MVARGRIECVDVSQARLGEQRLGDNSGDAENISRAVRRNRRVDSFLIPLDYGLGYEAASHHSEGEVGRLASGDICRRDGSD